MDDVRVPLKPNQTLTLDGIDYTIMGKPVGRGGSCLVYKAEKQCTPPHKVIIKEFYPKDYASSIKRDDDSSELICIRNAKSIGEQRGTFRSGVNEQVAFYEKDTNHRIGSFPTYHPKSGTINGMVYSVLDLADGKTLDEKRDDGLSLCDIAQIMQSLCNAVDVLHNSGKLYLDIKLENIFVFEKDVAYRVGLFDFDTVLDNNEKALSGSNQPFTPEWCAPEQRPWYSSLIGTATDVFAVGAVFYWLVSNTVVKSKWLDDITGQQHLLSKQYQFQKITI